MMNPTYHIGPATAEYLRREHGITDADLIGMGVVVSHAVAPGEVYKIDTRPGPQYGPWRPFTVWRWPIVRGGGIINMDAVA